MKRLVFGLRILLLMGVTAFLLLAPPRLQAALGQDPLRELLQGEREPWSGVVTIWHVVGFKTAQGSITAYLESCAALYEQEHPGVYVEVLGMEKGEMQERLMRGEAPDIWSFPGGLLYPERLQPLGITEFPPLRKGLAPAGWEGITYAVPYLYSGYYLLGNTGILQELGLSFPAAGEAGFEQALQNLLDMGQGGKRPQLSAPPLWCALLGLRGTPAEEGDFKAGQTALSIGNARALGDLSRKLSSGGFAFEAQPLCMFTDQVQYIGIASGASEQAARHGRGIIALLMSETPQNKIAALGALPAVEGIAPLYHDPYAKAMFEGMQAPAVLDPFLWQRYGEAAMEEAQRGLLQGDYGRFAERLAQALGKGTEDG